MGILTLFQAGDLGHALGGKGFFPCKISSPYKACPAEGKIIKRVQYVSQSIEKRYAKFQVIVLSLL